MTPVCRAWALTTVATLATLWGGPLERVPNETLRLPAELPAGSFRTENAFAGLSFSRPVATVTPPGERDRLFVVEQRGVISVIPSLANPSKETFLDLRSATFLQGESGLLGLAFHPNYAENRFFYVFYSTRVGGRLVQRVARFETDPEVPNRGLRESEVPMIDQRDDASNHNGGDLHFGPDGYLYISFGDEGRANDQLDNSRFIDRDFFGAIARIDVDRRPGSLAPNAHDGVYPGTYAIPPDNPFVGISAFMGRQVNPARVRTEFWAVGLRNPWRMSFDPPTGRLFTGDVGQRAREEINLIERGKHYGWSFREGTLKFRQGPGGAREPDVFAPAEPIWDYPHSQGKSVTGGVVYRGENHTELYEAYVFGDYVSGTIWALHFNDDGGVEVKQVAVDRRISAFGTDPRNGDVLFAAYEAGQIKRIVRQSSGLALLMPPKLSRTGAFADLETLTPHEGIVPYEPNVSFWSDGASKRRWFSVPELEDAMVFDPEKPWTFPTGTTWIKHFDLELRPGDASSRRRVETRFLVKTEAGSYGLTYAWNEAQTDASLVKSQGEEATFTMEGEEGSVSRSWSFPSRNACRACHTRVAGHALGFNTAQLNRAHAYPGGSANQLHALSEAGYFDEPLPAPEGLPQLARLEDGNRSLEDRARAYLETNCAQCHQPRGPALGFWDARAHVALAEAGLVSGALLNDLGDERYKVIAPDQPDESMILTRMAGGKGLPRMPPLGSTIVDEEGIALVRAWILSLGEGRRPPPGYEAWMTQFVDDLEAPTSAPEADPDRDGSSNEQEYLADTDPTRGDRSWRADLVISGLRPHLLLPPVAHGSLEIERSADAAVWSPWRPEPAAVTWLPDGTQSVALDGGVPRQFYRVRLGPPD